MRGLVHLTPALLTQLHMPHSYTCHRFVRSLLSLCCAVVCCNALLQMAALASVQGFHQWLQQGPMADGSWAREGVLHLRITDYKTPPKAVKYMQVGWHWHLNKVGRGGRGNGG